jgi:SAM-dependent MidA family methyltransferase
MWRLLGSPATFMAVEPGAGSGLLGQAVLDFSQHLDSGFHQALRYIALDRHWGGVSPGGPSSSRIEWVAGEGLPFQGVIGCILSNELLDSFPVHRFKVVEGRVLEAFVTLRGDQLTETFDSPSTPALEAYLRDLGIPLPEGLKGEVNLGLGSWVKEQVRALERGFVLTVDYGGLAAELYTLSRRGGTLRSYHKHTLSPSPYLRVGEQDITAHVDFSTLMALGARGRLQPLGYTSQRRFLLNLGFEAFREQLLPLRLPHRQELANRMGMEELLRPEGLGAFRVLAQGKGVSTSQLWGFSESSTVQEGLAARCRALPLPLLTAEHMPLLEGRYPHLAFDPEALWPWSGKPSPP